VIVATAGHVDHGKTALVRALTGVDTDTSPQEQRRGMSIDLGFAYLGPEPDAAGGAEPIGFIDVPGHHAFIRNALAGMAAADHTLLVVAADDGPMPQTLEHVAVLQLLEIPLAAVALTKVDRVDAARAAAVAQEIAALLQSAGLAPVPLFPLALPAGRGVPALRSHLERLATSLPQPVPLGNFRLAVDRAFSVSGAGLVVTGTVASGQVAVGDTVRLLGGGQEAKVRGLHAQHRAAPACRVRQRCALNLAGNVPRPEAIRRGDWVVAGDPPEPQSRMDGWLRLLAAEAAPLKHGTPVHVHLGAAHTTGRLAVLGGAQLQPGACGWVQLMLDQPLGAAAGDRFIVRDTSARRTLGGGRIVDVHPPLRGRATPQRVAELALVGIADAGASLAALLQAAPQGVLLEPSRRNRNLSPPEAAGLFDALPGVRVRTARGLLAFAPTHWAALQAAATASLAAWHARAPALAGPPPDRLLHASGLRLPRDAVIAIADALVHAGVIQRRGLGVCLPGHEPRLDAEDAGLWRQVEPRLAAAGIRPPSVFELSYALGCDASRLGEMLGRAALCGHAVRVSARHYYLPGQVLALAELAQALAAEEAGGGLTAAAYRDRCGVGRNLAIEVLEFFDHVKFTRRIGARHLLLAAPREVFGGARQNA
jgi:selenocysteine-specific elongation factor